MVNRVNKVKTGRQHKLEEMTAYTLPNTDSEPPPPRMSVIVPTLDGHRGGAVPRLLDTIQGQSFQDFELLLIKGVTPQGRAINQGAGQARGEILLILDDDSTLADASVFGKLLDTLKQDERIGMAGASITIAPDATAFERRAAGQFPRFCTPIVDAITDSDFACHGCCAIPKKVFEAIGGEREDILRGLDPDLRVRLRTAGYRVVLAPNAAIHHPMPGSWPGLLRIFFRNGFGSAYACKFRPETVYETHESLNDAGYVPRTTLAYRIIRFPMRLCSALMQGQTLRFGAYSAYAVGYLWGWLSAREIPDAAGPNSQG